MGQNTNINLGRKGQFGKINLAALKSGVKKSDIKNTEQIELFKKFDADKNGILTQDEMQKLVDSLGSYAQDGKITKREAKKFVKQNGLKGEVDKKQVFELLKNFGIASDNIDKTTVNGENINIRYNKSEDGSILTETLNKSDGALNCKTIEKDGKTVVQMFDDNGKIKQETTTENGVTTVVNYDENGNVTSTVRTKGAVTEYIENGRVTKKEVNKGSGGIQTTEYEYDKDGNVLKTTTTNPDGSQVIDDGTTTTTINPDGTKTVTDNETKEVQKFDKDGNLIEEEPEQVSTQDALKKLFGENQKASVTIDGTETGLSDKAYQGEIRLPQGQTIEDGKFPQTLRMSLPKSYGDNAAMTLTLIDPENGIYQSSAGDRNFQITTDENGNITVKSVNVDELSGKLNTNLAEYERIAEEKRLAEQNVNGQESVVKVGNSLTSNKIIYQKDSKGNVVYINKETGKQLTAEEAKAFVQEEATFITDKLYDAAKGGFGTKNKQFKEGIGNIYSREILQNVNEQLKAKGYTERKEGNTVVGMPIEDLILDEQSRTDALQSFRTMIENGVMDTKETARTVKRELEYEVDGGLLGITRTSKVDDIMMLVPNRETRVELEDQFAQDSKHKGLQPNEGSIVRAYLAADDWEPDEVDRFDANWVKNNSYSHEQDQEHRNGVIGRLVFEHNTDNDNENLKAGLDAVDTNSADYAYLSKKAEQENQKASYQKQFTTQDPVQQYIAGKTSDKGEVVAGEVSACNTLMYKGIKPINIQAEEALYDAKNGDLSHIFDSMDPKLYTQINTMLANGEIKGCNSLQDAYKQAMEKTTDGGEKARTQANAILSGQVEFSDEQITDFCVQLMHRIDTDRGSGASSHRSARFTNDANYETVQLKAILQANPNILAEVKAKVLSGEFKYTTVIDSGDGQIQHLEHDTKADYLQILADTKTVAKEAVFLDENGKKITDAQTIKRLQDANMKSLDAMREYVAQLEREYKLGTDAEGDLSDAANALSRYSGLGTDRGDVETKYREAKVLLDQLEAAAQGKLRDADGNVISAQDLAQQLVYKDNELMQTNNDYKSTIQTGKMAIVMAPVIAVTTVATGGLSLAAGATTGTTAAVLGSSWTAATVGGVATGATTYGMNAIEYNTSHTGNTAAARENNLTESLINGSIGATTAGIFKGAGNIGGKFGSKAATNETSQALVRVSSNEAGAVVKSAGNSAAGTAGKSTASGASRATGQAAKGLIGDGGAAEAAARKSLVENMENKISKIYKSGGNFKDLTNEETSQLAKILGVKPEELANMSKSKIRALGFKFHPDHNPAYNPEIDNKIMNILNNIFKHWK